MPARKPLAHLIQPDIAWESANATFARVESLLAGATISPGDLILLPEMFATGFSFNVSATAAAATDTFSFLTHLCDRSGAWVQAGRTLAGPGGLGLNVMTVLEPDPQGRGPRRVCEYTKIHPFGGEAATFAPGARVDQWRWSAAGLNVCPAICYDLRFPELFRRGMLAGAQLFALGACWPAVRHAHWRALLIARAIENQAFVLGCNRVGADPAPPLAGGFAYAGGSMVVGPRGDILGELDSREGVLSVEIDADAVHTWRTQFAAWKDTRLI